jgi:hypothetical protein
VDPVLPSALTKIAPSTNHLLSTSHPVSFDLFILPTN